MAGGGVTGVPSIAVFFPPTYNGAYPFHLTPASSQLHRPSPPSPLSSTAQRHHLSPSSTAEIRHRVAPPSSLESAAVIPKYRSKVKWNPKTETTVPSNPMVEKLKQLARGSMKVGTQLPDSQWGLVFLSKMLLLLYCMTGMVNGKDHFYDFVAKKEPLLMKNHTRNEITSNKGKEFGEEPNPKGRGSKQNRKTAHTADIDSNGVCLCLCMQLKETNFTKLCITSSVLTVNDSFPGPTIHVRKGDTAFVNVHNHGTYGGHNSL
ncbi:unnamed protein product [Camellia sinensis]